MWERDEEIEEDMERKTKTEMEEERRK